MVPVLIIVAATFAFFIAERALPGRHLPEAPGWYARAISSIFASSVWFWWLGSSGIDGCNRGLSFTFRSECRLFCKDLSVGFSERSYSIGGIAPDTTSTFCGESFIRFTTAPRESKP